MMVAKQAMDDEFEMMHETTESMNHTQDSSMLHDMGPQFFAKSVHPPVADILLAKPRGVVRTNFDKSRFGMPAKRTKDKETKKFNVKKNNKNKNKSNKNNKNTKNNKNDDYNMGEQQNENAQMIDENQRFNNKEGYVGTTTHTNTTNRHTNTNNNSNDNDTSIHAKLSQLRREINLSDQAMSTPNYPPTPTEKRYIYKKI